jgi:hypothetical protein
LREKDEPKGKAELSSYEDYTRKSDNYDKTREPVGTEILVGCFAHAPVPLNRTVVLDAGCGTRATTPTRCSITSAGSRRWT